MPKRPAPSLLRLGLAALLLSAGACAGLPPSRTQDPASAALVRRMGLGWNLGNTLEAMNDKIQHGTVRDYETAWGNPETSRALITAVHQAGFSSVRIPVAWSNGMGPDFQLSPALLDRVQWVVDQVLAEGMVAVVNIHWDGGWWTQFPTDEAGAMRHYRRVWEQIAARFKDYPDSLVFESLNEEGCFNDVWNRYGQGTPAQKERAYGILLRINQAFVDLVRASGGRNAGRHLLIAGYCTDVDRTVDPAFRLPADPAGREIVSVHYYTPFPFAGLIEDASWAKARATWGTPADLAELDANLAKLKSRFLDQGVPVIVGEYGSEVRNKDAASVRRYLLAVAEKLRQAGACPMLWDPGTHFDRRALRFNDPELAEGFRKLAALTHLEDPAAKP